MTKEERERLDTYLKGIVSSLPESPGSYQYLDDEGTIIYVGKAKKLKSRVSSYFVKTQQSAKTRILVSKIRDIKYTVVKTEEDAASREPTHQEVQAAVQRTAKGRQNLPFHRHYQGISAANLQYPQPQSTWGNVLRSILPRAYHVCLARSMPHPLPSPALHDHYDRRRSEVRKIQRMP